MLGLAVHVAIAETSAPQADEPSPLAVAPQINQVGPAAMPARIAPIVAPFEMQQPRLPQFPTRETSIVAWGAAANQSELVTASIQRAIDETSTAGGGVVVVPAGDWNTGRIELKSGVNLRVEQGARLIFSGQIRDYLPAVPARYEGLDAMTPGGLIYAHQATQIAVTGGGQLVGPADGPLREARPGLSDQLVDSTAPLEERIFDGQEGRHYFRPYFICLVECRQALIEGVSLTNGPMWNITPIYCEDVVVRGVTINSRGVVNGDGVNVESSRNVLVEYCQVDTGDDCFALKAGRNADGLRASRPVENVVFRFNRATGGFGGITCGSETAGGIRHVHVHDCVFENVRHAVYMKTRRPRGGGCEDVVIERVRFSAYNHAVFFDMIGSPLYVGELGRRLPKRELTPSTPYYRRITLRDLEGTCPRGDALKIKGIPESPAHDIEFLNCTIAGKGLVNLADVDRVLVSDCQLTADLPEVHLLDAANVSIRRCRIASSEFPPKIVTEGVAAKELTLDDVTPPSEQWNRLRVSDAPDGSLQPAGTEVR
ncbi:MAG: hypothetical protein KDA61_01425 [Planctomycetales bacterium]|nr:hypothetical protein [Planctomycetales bacterium]